MPFVQIIEFTTSKPDEVQALMEKWVEKTEGKRSAHRAFLTKDRDRDDTYLQIVEFPTYEDAMANSDLPETSYFAERIGDLCDGPLSLRNLDLVRDDSFSPVARSVLRGIPGPLRARTADRRSPPNYPASGDPRYIGSTEVLRRCS